METAKVGLGPDEKNSPSMISVESDGTFNTGLKRMPSFLDMGANIHSLTLKAGTINTASVLTLTSKPD